MRFGIIQGYPFTKIASGLFYKKNMKNFKTLKPQIFYSNHSLVFVVKLQLYKWKSVCQKGSYACTIVISSLILYSIINLIKK